MRSQVDSRLPPHAVPSNECAGFALRPRIRDVRSGCSTLPVELTALQQRAKLVPPSPKLPRISAFGTLRAWALPRYSSSEA